MPKHSLALQTWTVRDELMGNAEETLQRVADLGFVWLEEAGTGNRSPEEFSRLCSQCGLQIMGYHAPSLAYEPMEELLSDILRVCEVYNANYVTVAYPPDESRTTQGYADYAARTYKAAQLLQKHGVSLCFHCYDHDLRALEDNGAHKTGFDMILEGTPDGELGFELDTYFVRKAELPLEFIFTKCAGRCRLIHLDDIAVDGKHAPLGKGLIQWSDFLTMVHKVNSPEFLIIEHLAEDPLRWISESVEYIIGILSLSSGLDRTR